MNVYYLPDNSEQDYGKKFSELCCSVTINPQIKKTDNIAMMLNAGFTNCYAPIMHFGRHLVYEDNYPVSFLLDVNKKTKTIREMSVIDENFLQPHFVDKTLYNQIKKIINELIKKNILVKKNSRVHKKL